MQIEENGFHIDIEFTILSPKCVNIVIPIRVKLVTMRPVRSTEQLRHYGYS